MSLTANGLVHKSRTAFIVQGVLAVILGIMVLLWPGTTVKLFVGLIGAWMLVDGIINVIGWIATPRQARTVWRLVSGVVSILAGLVVFFLPQTTAVAIMVLVGIWAIMLGGTNIIGSLAFRRLGFSLWWVLLVAGILGVLVGVLLLMNPAVGILSVLWIVAIFVLAEGIASILLGIRIGSLDRETDPEEDR